MQKKAFSRFPLNDYLNGIINSDVTFLSRAITLVESNLHSDFELAQELLNKILPYTGKSIRIGITGAPGVGKSTFIDRLGYYLCNKNHKVAVLAIDPSSSISKGSILGDKTRMELLSQHPNSFIRPSPSAGSLGGVARKTRESILLCEAAGFDCIIVETIGVGQSEIAVRSMVDFFLLVIQPGGGDELQGFKKGSVEIADLIVINKADGENRKLAELTQREYSNALHYLSPTSEGWAPKVVLASAFENFGIVEIWNIINNFIQITESNGSFHRRRKEQLLNWLDSLIKDKLLEAFYNNPKVIQNLSEIEQKVFNEQLTPTKAVEQLFFMLNNENTFSDQ